MPEAFACFFVTLIAVGMYVGALIHARRPGRHDSPKELARLRDREEWLRQRLHQAQRENWGDEMTAAHAAELATITGQPARVQTR